MRSVAPRRLAHRGVVEAEGLRLHADHLAPGALAERALALAEPGTQFLLDGEDLLVLWAAPRSIDTRRAVGTALVRHGGALSPVPLEDDELEILAPAAHTLVIVEAGKAKVESFEAFERFDPASLLDLSRFKTATVESLGEPPPPVASAAPQVRVLARHLLEGEGSAAIQAAKAEIEERLQGASREASAGLGAAALGLWAAIREWLKPKPKPGSPLPAVRGAPRPRFVDRVRHGLQRLLANLVIQSRLARFFGARQARYLSELLRDLDGGDLDAALRRAIPLADPKKPSPRPSVPSLGVPKARSSLAIQTGATPDGASAMMVGDDLYALLRDRYRRAFEQLDREGRYEEAAFVLAELLREDEAAVDYLEQKEQFRLAAELAESRNLPPGLVVRLWALAGDWRRALLHARLHRAFAEGTQHLSKTHPAAARELRMRWADVLAESGRFLEAAELLWPMPEGKSLAKRFVELGLEAGGPDAARILLLALELEPERKAELGAKVLAIFDDDEPARFFTRHALLQGILDRTRVEGRGELARGAIRSLFRDSRLYGALTGRHLRQLETIAGDSILRTDLPPAPQIELRLRSRPRPLELEIPAADRGIVAIADVARLPSGRFLVALGEAGVSLYSIEGKRLLHFDQPCTRLVVSDGGHRAITTAPRGWLTRLGRIDLVHQRAHGWGQQPLRSYADTFDGWRWYVGLDHRLVALDATATGFTPEWQLANCPPVAIIRTPEQLAMAVMDPSQEIELWTFEQPNPVLRRRATWPRDESMPALRHSAFNAAGSHHVLDCFDSTWDRGDPSTEEPTVIKDWRLGHYFRGHLEHAAIDLPPGVIIARFEVHAGISIILTKELMGVVVRGFQSSGRLLFKITLAGASQGTFRVSEKVLAIGDDLGRVTAIDLDHGTIVGRFRVAV